MIAPPAHVQVHTNLLSAKHTAENLHHDSKERNTPASNIRPAGRMGTLVYVMFPFAPVQAAVRAEDELATPTVNTADVLVYAVQPPIVTLTFVGMMVAVALAVSVAVTV